MIIQIEDYFIGMIFKGNQLVKNTIPLKDKEIFKFMNGDVIKDPDSRYHKVGKIILKLYFAEISDKKARELIDYKLEVPPFTRKVLDIVKTIDVGRTLTYGDIAKQLNTSPRAIGMALKRNPLPLIIPCHRVVAKNSLGGYSYGLDRKKFILQQEGLNSKV